MTEKAFLTLISRIDDDLEELILLKNKIDRAWEKYNMESEEFYLDSVALNLHGFYSGLEKIFLLIAREIDESVPEGGSWHQELLEQMAIKIKKIRPSIIDKNTKKILDEYRGFRHIVRNVYSYNYSAKKIKVLVEDLDENIDKIIGDIKRFLEFLEEETSY
ncbi:MULTISPECIES: hypothetical protein [unclassified Halanaerobium]|uniref:ribonuclease toxin HepT-like protein n=1 Tax=unclassified Halanaerobium TaxID=2641197 RepID=UPI000E1968CE|nr:MULTISPECIES: hypothetical protein [unclassified Halanaerobium]RCW44106.1 hypothetical protein DFR78_1217 [Halanaerobium sp. MA284_MarDTE_T2]RCW86964.1 hypothetical protein DER71_10672 [Halanaerobium sp. DL-01]